MDTSVRINVRATFGDAQAQFARLIGEVDKLDAAARRGAVGTGVLDTALKSNTRSLEVWGKKLQYNGSILTRNFTLPLALAFGVLTKQEMDYQRSLASLEQVYKRNGSSVTNYQQNLKNMREDLGALDQIVVTLSSHYGIQRKEVADMATELGRAGSTGANLAVDTESAALAQRAYNLTAHDAVGVITTLRASYHLTSSAARDALGVMAVSNESTRGSFDLLAQGMIRAAPVAVQLGVPIRNLVALLSTFNQAGFKGGESGNALSAGLQRLVVITPKAADLLKKLGIDAQGAAFQSLNGAQRIQVLADHLKGANGDLVAYTASVVFGVQRSKQFDVAIADLANRTGSYHSILDATTSSTKNAGFLAEQLGIKLSNPAVAFDVLKITAENNARVIGQKLLPVLSYLMNIIVQLTAAFAALSPTTQMFIIWGAVLLALVGPIMRVVGAFALLADYAKKAVRLITGNFLFMNSEARREAQINLEIQQAAADKEVAINEAKFSAIRAEQAVNSAAYRAQLIAMNEFTVAANVEQATLMKANLATTAAQMTALVGEAEAAQAALVVSTEEAVAAGSVALEATFPPMLALTVVLAVIAGAAYLFRDQFLRAFEQIAEALGYIVAEIYALLQYLNPFQRHSPSLVDNVEAGTAQINRHYANMARQTSSSMSIVKRALAELNAALANGPNPGVKFSITRGFTAVKKQGNAQDIAAYRDGITALQALNKEQAAAKTAMTAQEKVVKSAKDAYTDAGLAIKGAEGNLKDLEKQQKDMQGALDKLGDPAALRSQATAASAMGRSLLAAGNPALAAQFGAQADKLNAQADKATKAKEGMDKLSKEIDNQKDAIDKLRDARDALLATYDAEKEKLDGIKATYDDITGQINEITNALQQLAQAATAANTALAATHKHPKGPGGGKNPGLPGALGSKLPGASGGIPNVDPRSLEDVLKEMKTRLGNSVGAMFPNPAKGIGDFFHKLKTSFKKGWDDFTKNKFQDAFGFGKGWGTNLQHGMALGIGLIGTIIAVKLFKAFRYLISGRWITDAFRFGKNFIRSIIRGTESEAGGLGEKFGLGIRHGITNLLRWVGRAGPLMRTALRVIGQAIIDAAPEWATAAAEAVGGVLIAIADLPILAIVAIGVALVAILVAFYKWHDPIWNFAKSIPGWIWDGVTAAWDSSMHFLSLIGDWLSRQITGGAKAFGNFAKKIPGWLMDGIKTAWEKGFYLIGFIAGWLVIKGVEFGNTFSKWARKIPGWIMEGIEFAWDGALKLAKRVGKWLKDESTDAYDHLKSWGTQLPHKIWGGVTSVWNTVLNLPGRILDWFKHFEKASTGHLKTWGTELPPKIWKGVLSAWDKAMDLGKKIRSWLGSVLSDVGGALLDAGKNIVSGIASGISGAFGAVKNAITNVVTGAKDGANKASKAQSPSRLFADEVGRWIAEGIGVGISEHSSHATKAAVNNINSVYDAMHSTINMRSNAMVLPTLTQNIRMQRMGGPDAGPMMSGASGGASSPADGGSMTQHINVNMGDQQTTADPHEVASALAWKMRMAGRY